MSADIPRLELRDAIELAIAGEWRRCHEIVQRYEDDKTACWVHAVLHRVEGDLGNAQYWYRRAGRAMPEGSSPDATGKHPRSANLKED